MKRERGAFANENDLIARIVQENRSAEPRGRHSFSAGPSAPNLVGIGDDCAVVNSPKGKALVLTTDALVDQVHFDLDRVLKRPHGLEHLGKKSAFVNISDIASMGALPKYALLTLGVPKHIRSTQLMSIVRGVILGCRDFGASLVGGDTVRSDRLFVSVALTGEASKKNAILRSGAKDKDLIMVTGELGLSALGLGLLSEKISRTWLSSSLIRRSIERHELPAPRVNEAKIAAQHGASAMMDVSDGLQLDLSRLLAASQAKALLIVQDVPSPRLTGPQKESTATREIAKKAKSLQSHLKSLALSGGEDYEMIITASEKAARSIQKKILHETGTSVSVLGRIDNSLKESMVIEEDGSVGPLQPKGYDHFVSL